MVEDILQELKFIDLKYILQGLLAKQVPLLNIEKILELVLKNINEDKEIIIQKIAKEMKIKSSKKK